MRFVTENIMWIFFSLPLQNSRDFIHVVTVGPCPGDFTGQRNKRDKLNKTSTTDLAAKLAFLCLLVSSHNSSTIVAVS